MDNKFHIPNSGFNKILKTITDNPAFPLSLGEAIIKKRKELEEDKKKQGWFKNEYGQWQKKNNN